VPLQGWLRLLFRGLGVKIPLRIDLNLKTSCEFPSARREVIEPLDHLYKEKKEWGICKQYHPAIFILQMDNPTKILGRKRTNRDISYKTSRQPHPSSPNTPPAKMDIRLLRTSDIPHVQHANITNLPEK
jgi:hypothetical protein